MLWAGEDVDRRLRDIMTAIHDFCMAYVKLTHSTAVKAPMLNVFRRTLSSALMLSLLIEGLIVSSIQTTHPARRFSQGTVNPSEEFDVAWKSFKDKGKPLIYTYFNKAAVSTSARYRDDSLSLWDFQKKLEDLGHFHTEYDSVAGLQKHFRDQLDNLRGDGLVCEWCGPRPGPTVACDGRHKPIDR